MRLYYWRFESTTNFGDMLNPWLWPKFFPGLFDDDDDDSLFLGIGTVLNTRLPPAARRTVLGSGVGYGDPPVVDSSWTFYGVRGALTRDVLGLPSSIPLGDPAILVPDLLAEDSIIPSRSRQGTVFVPHWTTREGEWREVCSRVGVGLVDPLAPVEEVLSRIVGSELVIAEAMHGAIIADAFRIPWIAVHTDFSHYSPFKWRDWCSALGMEYRSEPMVRPWSPPDFKSGMLRSLVKLSIGPSRRRLAARRLEGILRDAPRQLSADAALETSKRALYGAVEKLREDLGLRSG